MSSQTMNRTSLPVDPFLQNIADAFEHHASVIILAEPGAGKSTRVPYSLMTASKNTKHGTWIMLQPRRWAAKLVAHRIAEENHLRIGEEVGYQVRFENKTSSRSRLVVMTEGVLLKKLLNDPELKGIEGVILDEFHERSLDLDLSLALLKELQESFRPDLKMVVMSATLDPASLLEFLPRSKLFEIPGRTFPVKKKFLGEVPIAQAVEAALDEVDSGDGLVFLPGAFEIERAIESIRSALPRVGKDFDLLPLYSSLPDREQQKVFDQTNSRRKIIFATNIAETSITLPKIKFVIDSGLTKVMRNDPQLGQDRLELLKISRASSEQRAGRAGRVSEGTCFRLWKESEHSQLRQNETPEVHRLNLSSSFLFLAAYGVPDAEKFDWFERPKSSATQFAKEELRSLGFVVNGQITEEGKHAAVLPLPPPLAKLKITGHLVPDFVARLAAFLEEKNSASISDWDHLLRALNQLSQSGMRSAEQIAGRSHLERVHSQDIDEYEKVLIQSLSSRVFIQGKKVGRRNVRLQNPSAVLPAAGLILHSIERDERGVPTILIRNYVPLSVDALKKFAQKKRVIDFDTESGRVRAKEGLFFEDLALGTETDVAVTSEEASQALKIQILKDPEAFFTRDDEFRSWKKRFDLWKSHSGEEETFPWLDLVESATQGKTRIKEVMEFPWRSYLENVHPVLKQVERDLPERLTVPTGNQIKVDYESSPPKLSVRLQEIFGWLETPQLMQGKVPLVIELLSPGFRPIQLTRDLKSFWNNAYFEVKKELKIRYPKHAWPEDPLTAKPEAKGRRRNP